MGWRLFILYYNVFTKIGLRWWKNDGPWIRGCVGNLDSWAVTKAATSYKPLRHALDTVERRLKWEKTWKIKYGDVKQWKEWKSKPLEGKSFDDYSRGPKGPELCYICPSSQRDAETCHRPPSAAHCCCREKINK